MTRNYAVKCRLLIVGVLVLACSHTARAQKSSYAPFIIDSSAVTAVLKVKNSALEDHYAPVFAKHKLNASSPVDWLTLLERIAGMRETDLYISNEITFEATDENVELSAIHFDNLEQMVKSLRQVICTPEKVTAFLNEYEHFLQKKK